MHTLSKTWLTDHLIDFEYKKYVVLDYVKKVKDAFQDSKLYPPLSEAIDHLRELQSIRHNANIIRSEGSKSLSGIDWESLQLIYNHPDFDSGTMDEVNKIIDFALPNFQSLVQDGKSIFDLVEKHLVISQIGIMPIRHHEGYLFFSEELLKNLYVYQYAVCRIQTLHEQANMLALEYVGNYALSVKWTYENVKRDVIERRKDMPNPAVYAIACDLEVPFSETFLPVAKRYFMRHVAQAA